MKQKIFLFIIGLMSLVMMTACEDEYSLEKEAGFCPKWFMADEMQEGVLQIVGPEWLAFDQITKDDWLIAVQPRTVFAGDSPLEMITNHVPITEEGIVRLSANHGQIPVGLDRLTVSYTYMGQELELKSWRGLYLNIEIIPDEDQTPEEGDPSLYSFYQKGVIKYILCDGKIPLKSLERPFRVFDLNY